MQLIYPPISGTDGPGRGSPDRLFVPHGLLTIAARLRDRGIDASVLNLAAMTCAQAAETVRRRPADLIGLSCYTFQRHIAASLGAAIRSVFPKVHLTIGGPHVSAMPRQWLEHYVAFDSVVIGEGEATVEELVEALRQGRPYTGIAGTAYREAGVPTLGPARERIRELDRIGKPWRYFDYEYVITSRGCPGQCTFCSSPTYWGSRIRFRPVEDVLEELEELVLRRGHRFLCVKDDTFTANRGRAIAICQEIASRGLEFRWACDTRVDCLNAELLAAMRRAGCMKVSLGIESAAPAVLAGLRKTLDPDKAAMVTAEARELGLDVRFYLMVGCRGETAAGLRTTGELVIRARPTHLFVTALNVYPGTEEFANAEERGEFTIKQFFDDTGEFYVRNIVESAARLGIDASLYPTLETELAYAPYTLAEREAIFGRHGDMRACALELADAYLACWRLADAQRVLEDTQRRVGRASPLLRHYLACVRFAGKDTAGAQSDFLEARKAWPADTLLARNLRTIAGVAIRDEGHHRALSLELFNNLRDPVFIVLHDGQREPTSPLPAP
ncbi:MAG: radical SAM protein [Tepidisphaeraceae bacterium]